MFHNGVGKLTVAGELRVVQFGDTLVGESLGRRALGKEGQPRMVSQPSCQPRQMAVTLELVICQSPKQNMTDTVKYR